MTDGWNVAGRGAVRAIGLHLRGYGNCCTSYRDSAPLPHKGAFQNEPFTDFKAPEIRAQDEGSIWSWCAASWAANMP